MPKRPSDPLEVVDVDSLLTDEERAIRATVRQLIGRRTPHSSVSPSW